MNFLDRTMRPLFWAALLFSYAMAVMPRPPVTLLSSDKSQHMLAFFTLALLAGLGWRGVSLWLIGAALAGFGLLIEVTQAIPALHRDPSGADLVADCLAILVALPVAGVGRSRLPWPRA